MKFSIGVKIILFNVICVVSASLLAFAITFYDWTKADEASSIDSLTKFQRTIQEQFKDKSLRFSSEAERIAFNQDFIQAVASKNVEEVQKISTNLLKEKAFDLVTVTDEKGIVLGRGHSTRVGDDLSKRRTVVLALEGKSSIGSIQGTEILFSLQGSSPIYKDDILVGSVGIGFSWANEEFIDNIKIFNFLPLRK